MPDQYSFNDPQVDPEVEAAIVNAFKGSGYKWRTPEGIVATVLGKDTSATGFQSIAVEPASVPVTVEPQEIKVIAATLENSEKFIRSGRRNRLGKPLYSLRSRYVRNANPVQRFVAGITGQVI